LSSVVIADDHSFFRAGLETALTADGYDVIASVADGISAYSAIRDRNPNFAILDVRMPNKDGISTLTDLRKEGNQCPVILLAAEYEDAALVEAIQSGANALVSKTNAHQTLIEAIAAISSGGQYFEEGFLSRFVELTRAGSQVVQPRHDGLSLREEKIAHLVAQGMRNRQIGEEVGLSEAMVKLYLHRIYARLGLANRTELALYMQKSENSDFS
jgi:two-component system, NarL family, nitrate/nitrite response regulator NarL